jgi:hypothetical protein
MCCAICAARLGSRSSCFNSLVPHLGPALAHACAIAHTASTAKFLLVGAICRNSALSARYSSRGRPTCVRYHLYVGNVDCSRETSRRRDTWAIAIVQSCWVELLMVAAHSLARCSRTSYIQVVYLLLHLQSPRPRAFCTATMTTQVSSRHAFFCCHPN